MKKNSLVVFLGLSLWSTLSFGLEIQYDQEFFKDLERYGFGRGAPFEESFKCGESKDFTSTITFCELTCTDSYCDHAKCRYPESKEAGRFTLTPEDCSANEVFLFGSNGYKAKISREEYEKARNNWFMVFLQNIGKFVQPISTIKIDWGTPAYLHRVVDGKKEMIPGAFHVFGTMQVGEAKNLTSFSLYITNAFNGPAQVLYFGMGSKDEVFYKLKGLKWGMPQ